MKQLNLLDENWFFFFFFGLTCIVETIQDGTVPNWKALSGGKYEKRGLSCGNPTNICQEVVESANFLHKPGFVDYLSVGTVNDKKTLDSFGAKETTKEQNRDSQKPQITLRELLLNPLHKLLKSS